MSVVIVGSVAYDSIETPFAKKEKIIGGASIYGALGISFFTKAHIVGIAGNDFNMSFLKNLKQKNIDIQGLKIVNGKTFFWQGKYHYDMKTRESLKTELNVFADFNPEIPEKYKKIPYLFLANINPALQLKVLNSMKNLKFTICDTMNYWIKNDKKNLLKVFNKVNCIVLNDEEIREFTGIPNLIKGAKFIQKFGPKYVIIKKGEYGASILGPDFYFTIPSFPVEDVIDPTGAGDSFGGAFIGYIAKQNKINKNILKKAISYANIVASFTVEDFGITKLMKIKIKDIEDRLRKLKEYSLF
jgi:sugar/nucleoside kinase (ribokinase family)